jgi:hypothetical protein
MTANKGDTWGLKRKVTCTLCCDSKLASAEHGLVFYMLLQSGDNAVARLAIAAKTWGPSLFSVCFAAGLIEA